MRRAVRTWGGVVALSAAMGPLPVAAEAQVVLRDGGRIETMLDLSTAGVRARTPNGAVEVISWDRVRRVEGAHAVAAEAFMPLAQRAWRARSRLARGDIALAAPLFEHLFSELGVDDGPTPLLAAEGALACRLALGETTAAVEAHLRARALRAAGAALPSDVWSAGAQAPLPPVMDAQTNLAPALSPWLLLPGSRFAQEVWTLTERMGGDDPLLLSWRLVSGAMSGLATQAQLDPLREAMDRPYDAWDDALLRDAALALAGSADQRARARRALAQGLTLPRADWAEAWRRLALGRSRVLEEDAEDLRSGAIELLHLPARFGRALPRYAGVALALAAEALHRLGDEAGAGALRQTLAQTPASQASLAWLDARLRIGAEGASDHAQTIAQPMPLEPNAAEVRSDDEGFAQAAQEEARR